MLPTFLVVGAMKCGTTSLHQYLRCHPEIFMPRKKELDYFVEEKNYPLGIDWYKSHFPLEAKAAGEVSPNYSKYPLFTGVPKRIYEGLGQIKVIYIIREPFERLVSHYVHAVLTGIENNRFTKAIRNPNNSYLVSSLYYQQVSQYLEYFSLDHILLIKSEDFRNHRRSSLNKIFRFLNVDGSYTNQKFDYEYNRTVDVVSRVAKQSKPLKGFCSLKRFAYTLTMNGLIHLYRRRNFFPDIKEILQNDIAQLENLVDHGSFYPLF